MREMKILIVEDEKYTRDTLALVLENSGYKIIDVANGKDALAVIFDSLEKNDPVDIIVLDIELPGLSGLQVIETLRTNNFWIPILVITGLMDTPVSYEIQHGQCIRWLMKPFNPDSVVECVQSITHAYLSQNNTELT